MHKTVDELTDSISEQPRKNHQTRKNIENSLIPSKPGSFIAHFTRRKKSFESADYQYLKIALKSIHNRSQNSSKANLPGSSLSFDSNEYLSTYEKSEILLYPTVYYLRNELTKVTNSFSDKEGFYKATVKDHLAYRFEIIEVLGQGTFGQVVRCMDHKSKQEVAIKIIRKFKQYQDSGRNEIKIIEILSKGNCKSIVKMFDFFEFREHLCIVYELLSINLSQMMEKNNFSGFSFSLVRRFTQQILNSLVHVHANNVIHCDLKPENILLKQEKKSVIKIIDFGSSCEESRHLHEYIQSRFYRAPEIVIDAGYDKSIDIWSLGCIVVEFITGKPLFNANSEIELIGKFIEVLGKPPEDFLDSGKRSKIYFDFKGMFKGETNPLAKKLEDILYDAQPPVVDFVKLCLAWKPSERISAEEGLSHYWFRTGRRSEMSSVEPGSRISNADFD
jgi:dual specificity tyrosine-phosphorylation-regulated kinase 2/3/4